MGHLCRLQGRWEEARRYFTIALARRPTTPTLHYYVGVVSEEIGTERYLEVHTHVRDYEDWVCVYGNRGIGMNRAVYTSITLRRRTQRHEFLDTMSDGTVAYYYRHPITALVLRALFQRERPGSM